LESERESRLVVDRIPGQVAVLDTSGEVERVIQPPLDYLGGSPEELRLDREFRRSWQPRQALRHIRQLVEFANFAVRQCVLFQ
jgi:hypothetical protein